MIIDLAKIYRGKNVESIHYGIACLANSEGVLKTWGDSNFKTYTRSIIKPIQLKVCLDLGLELEEQALTLAMASHKASEEQRFFVKKILDKYEIKESMLACGCTSVSRGKLPSAIYHNCSGKHAAILATSKINSWDLENYLNFDHPIQLAIKKEIETLMPGIDMDLASDGCGLATFYLKLSELAILFAKITEEKKYQKIIAGMNAYPLLISSEEMIDARIMNLIPGKFIAKVGAEGLLMVSNLDTKESLILKIIDGSMRARANVMISLMEHLSWIKNGDLSFEKDYIIPRLSWD